MNTTFTKKGISIALSGCLISLASFASSAYAEESPEPIKIALNNWSSQQVLANVTGLMLKQIGYNIEYHQADAQRQFTDLGSGQLHFQAEVWEGTMAEEFERQVSRKRVIDAGPHTATTREEWWYPYYVAELCPGLPDWKALNKCADIFSTPETEPLGRYLAGPVDWERTDRERVEALKLKFEVVNAKSRHSLRAKLDQAIINKQPILVQKWTPSWRDRKYSGEFVNFPEHKKECETEAEWGENPQLKHDCGNPKQGYLKKAVWSEFPQKWSCGYELIKNINFTNEQITAAAAFAEVDEMSAEEAAKRWMGENPAVWGKWIPACADSFALTEPQTEATKVAASATSAVVDATEIAANNNCMGCHGIENKIVGPGFNEVAAKYKSDDAAVATLVDRIKNGGSGNWGAIPMPANPNVSDADADTLAKWILSK